MNKNELIEKIIIECGGGHHTGLIEIGEKKLKQILQDTLSDGQEVEIKYIPKVGDILYGDKLIIRVHDFCDFYACDCVYRKSGKYCTEKFIKHIID